MRCSIVMLEGEHGNWRKHVMVAEEKGEKEVGFWGIDPLASGVGTEVP